MIQTHPCFGEKAHYTYARIHLPVAEQCNIQCRYCSRDIGITYHSYRPGVAREIISPQNAVEWVSFHMTDRLKVAGIAGPGEPLCNKATFETFSLVHAKYPDLILCVATNGLLLPEKVEILAELGVKTVTVTINTVREETVKKIYAHLHGKMNNHVARTFIQNQLKGIQQCADHGIIVKINSILIPEINMNDLEEVALHSRERGAYIQNITPLIPLGEFSEKRSPTCEEIRMVRDRCEKILPQFRLCKQCRADSVGIPGKNETF